MFMQGRSDTADSQCRYNVPLILTSAFLLVPSVGSGRVEGSSKGKTRKIICILFGTKQLRSKEASLAYQPLLCSLFTNLTS